MKQNLPVVDACACVRVLLMMMMMVVVVERWMAEREARYIYICFRQTTASSKAWLEMAWVTHTRRVPAFSHTRAFQQK